MLTPIPYGSVETWSTALWEVWVLATAILWVILILRDGEFRFEPNPLVVPMLLLLVYGVIQIFPLGIARELTVRETISFDPYLTMQACIKLFASILFFAMFATFVDTDERRKVAVRVILGVCIVIALIGVGQNYVGRALWRRGQFGPFVNRNHFAGFLEMGIGLASAAVILRSVRLEMIAVHVCGVLIMCAGLILSASRGGVLALGAQLVFLALLAFTTARDSKAHQPSRVRGLVRAGGVVGLGAGAVLVAILMVGSERLIANFAQAQDTFTQEQLNNERYNRRDIWRATWELVKRHPVTGVGLGAFQVAYTQYDPSSGTQRVEQAHNDYLQILADAGLIGGALAVLFIIILLVRGLKACATEDIQRRAIAMGALTGCFGIVVHSLVDFNLQITSNAQLFLALAALATMKRERHGRAIRKRKRISQSRSAREAIPASVEG